MSSNRRNLLSLCWALLAVIGCSLVNPTPLWISVTKPNVAKYTKARVGLLPPSYSRQLLPDVEFSEKLQGSFHETAIVVNSLRVSTAGITQ